MVITYILSIKFLGRGTSRALHAASSLDTSSHYDIEKEGDLRATAAYPFVKRTEPSFTAVQGGLSLPPAPAFSEEGESSILKEEEPVQKSSLFPFMPSFVKRPEKIRGSELFENNAQIEKSALLGHERLKAKINHVIQSRVRRGPELVVNTSTETRTMSQEQDKSNLDFQSSSLRIEPHVTIRQFKPESTEDLFVAEPFERAEQKGLDILEDMVL